MAEAITGPTEQNRRQLLWRLRAIRRAGRIASVVVGCSQLWLLAVVAALLAIWLDYSLRLPGVLRLLIAMAIVGCSFLAIRRLVIRRLRQPSLPHIARQVQGDLLGPPDSLASGVEFASASDAGWLSQQTIAIASQLMDQLAVTRLVRWRWLFTWLLAALLSIALPAATWYMNGWWVRRGLQRYAWPAMAVQWPRRVQITSLFSGQEILTPPAEPVTLQAQIAYGPDHTAAHVVLADGVAGQVRKFEMTDGGAGLRTVTVRPLTSGAFWFEAGDDTTRATPGHFRVTPRPQVVRAEILVQPPAYTAQPSGRFALGAAPVKLPAAADAQLVLTISKDLAQRDGRPQATIILSPLNSGRGDADTPLDVQWHPEAMQLTANWLCRYDSLIRAEFTDTDGLTSTPLQPWRILVQNDRLPTVDLLAPADNIEVAPGALLDVQARATDDWGIADVQLIWQVANAESSRPPQSVPLSVQDSERIGDTLRATIEHAWSLQPLALSPGDRITWHVAVQDNFILDGRTHDPVHSPSRTIRVISTDELLKSVLDKLALTRRKIAELQNRQNDLAQTLAAPAAATQPAETLARQADTQGQLAQQARTTSAVLTGAGQRLAANRIERKELTAAVLDAAENLRRIASSPMARTQNDLLNAQAQPSAAPQRATTVTDAAKAAQDAAQRLAQLLQQTGAWTTVESAQLGLQDLIARQQTLRDQTQQAGRTTLGQSPADLSTTQRQDLQHLADAQRALATQLQQLQADMAHQASLPAAPPQLQQAIEAVETTGAVAAMAGSADQIARNITAAAQQRQELAQQAMQQALDALRGLGPQHAAAPQNAQSQQAAAMAEQLKELARQQSQIKEQTRRIQETRDPAGRLDRAGQMRLGMAGRTQASLSAQAGRLGQMAPDASLQQSIADVSQQMDRIAGQMQNGDSDPQVQGAQQQAARQLMAMAEAIGHEAGNQDSQAAGDSSQQANANRPGNAGANQPRRGGSQAGQSSQDEQAQQGQGQAGAAGSRGKQGGSQAATDSAFPADQEPTAPAALPSRIGEVEAWGFLPPDQRRRILQGMQAQPPPRYRKLTERYWKTLNETVAGQDGGS